MRDYAALGSCCSVSCWTLVRKLHLWHQLLLQALWQRWNRRGSVLVVWMMVVLFPSPCICGRRLVFIQLGGRRMGGWLFISSCPVWCVTCMRLYSLKRVCLPHVRLLFGFAPSVHEFCIFNFGIGALNCLLHSTLARCPNFSSLYLSVFPCITCSHMRLA
jgi:hypothetical protein